MIDYAQEDFTRGSDRYDLVLDNVLNHPPSATARVLAPGGVFMPNSVGNTGGLFAGLPRMARAALMRLGRTNVRFVNWKVGRENLTALATLLQSGDVRVVISETYPLADAATAVAHMLGHHAVGKLAITV